MLTTLKFPPPNAAAACLLQERKAKFVRCVQRNFIPTQPLAHTASNVHRSTSLIRIDILRYSQIFHCKFPFP